MLKLIRRLKWAVDVAANRQSESQNNYFNEERDGLDLTPCLPALWPVVSPAIIRIISKVHYPQMSLIVWIWRINPKQLKIKREEPSASMLLSYNVQGYGDVFPTSLCIAFKGLTTDNNYWRSVWWRKKRWLFKKHRKKKKGRGGLKPLGNRCF